MLQEEKELLLKDLCARLSYGVIVAYKSRESEGRISLGYGNIGYVAELGRGWWTDCKPYLRPMSSMTSDEFEEFTNIMEHISIGKLQMNIANPEAFDWLNKHHFDYRGLIEKSLALEAPEGMYKLSK